jgi:aryl-alcohol dehydrogenase-like predicted oxidoreductase
MITEAIKICDNLDLEAPVADQCEYNCLQRAGLEKTYRRLFERFGYGSTVWSPLCGGLLTGKYNDGTIDEEDRYQNPIIKAMVWDRYMGDKVRDKTLQICRDLKEYSEELGYTMAQIALAWVLVNKDVSTCLMGATRISQIDSNLEALKLATNWNQEIEDKINGILNNEPVPRIDHDSFAPDLKRRPQTIGFDLELGVLQKRELKN